MRRDISLLGKLVRAFVISTFLPFLSIVVIAATLFNTNYQGDLTDISQGYLDSLGDAVSQYIANLRQITLIPYFDHSSWSLIQQMSEEDVLTTTSYNQLYDQLGGQLGAIRYTCGDYYSAMIVSGDKTLFFSSNASQSEPLLGYDWNQESWYRDSISHPENIIFLGPHIPRYLDRQDLRQEPRISLVRSLNNLITRKSYAVIKVDILPSSLGKVIEQADFAIPSRLALVDRDGTEIWSRSDEGFHDARDSHDIRLSALVADTPYLLEVVLDGVAIRHKTNRIYVIGFLFYALTFLSALLLNLTLARRTSGPVEEMKKVLLEVQKGNFSIRYQDQPDWNLHELGKSLNIMLARLEETIQYKYVAELDKKEAENKFLLSQIQAHFLFNSINSMLGLLYKQDYAALETSLYGLSGMLRYALRQEQVVTLQEEAACMHDYLAVQQGRFGKRLAYSVNIAPEAANTRVPRLFIQPFLENSVVHGMEPVSHSVHISVDARGESDGSVVLVIKDDGAGFDPRNISYEKRTGITNCIERLRRLWPEGVCRIESESGKGTLVTIVFKGVPHENTGS